MIERVFGVFQGVPIFFMLSGFLIWNSLDRTPDVKTYMKKRVLRLYPELWGSVVVSIVSIIILYRKTNYIQLCIFAITQSTILQFWTPDSLRGYGVGTPNGSLWTIGVIVQFYIIGWFMKKLTYRWKSKMFRIMFLVICTVAGIMTPVLEYFLPDTIYKLYGQTAIPYLWIFCLGAFVCEYFDFFIPLFKRLWIPSLVLLIVLCIAGLDIHGSYGVVKTILQTITWLGFAYAFPCLNLKHDVSYGLYLYHMIVINIFVQLGRTENWLYFAVSLIISFILATISYCIFTRR